MSLPVLQLKKDQERRLLAGHSWIYSNEVDATGTPLTRFSAGSLAIVKSSREKSLGIAYINLHTLLCARLLTRDVEETIDQEFFSRRLRKALQRRQRLFSEPYYRWVFSESDELPGLILDRFADVISGQINTAGMEMFQDWIQTAILELTAPETILWRNDSAYRALEYLPQMIQTGYGKPADTCTIRENGCVYHTSIISGQKTGWFYDHRDNRARVAKYVKDKKVLDVFSYIGAFAIPAARAGARQVTCIDSSAAALETLKNNAAQNQVSEQMDFRTGDAFALLKSMREKREFFDVIILDPPAFIKKKKDYKAGLRAYEHINALALSLLKPDGVLFSASCSMHLSAADLLNCIRRAGIAEKRRLIVLEQLHQAADHPIHPAIEETNYLKGFILMA